MKGSLLHNSVVSYGKTFVALTRCLQIQLSTTNLVKDMHTRKVQRKSPLMHGYLYASGGLLTILARGGIVSALQCRRLSGRRIDCTRATALDLITAGEVPCHA